MKKGFTLIELIIVVGLMVVAALTALVNLSGAKYGRDLANTTREVAAVIRDTQNNVITQKDGKRWGIRFTNSISGAHKYEVFSSSSYATSVVERLFSLSRGIKFSEPGTGLYFDQVFEALTGKPSASKYISLVNNRRDGLVGDILLHRSGRLTTKIESGLVGYWHFDEATSTTVYDASGFGNSGTLYSSSTICANPPTSGCPAWQAATNCRAGSCLRFDGTNDYLNLPDAVLKSDVVSVSAWIKTTETRDLRAIVDRANTSGGTSAGWRFDIRSSGALRFRLHTNNGVVAPEGGNITDGNWHLAVGTYDGQAVRVYIDGSEVASLTLSGNIKYTGVSALTVGSQVGGTSNFLNAIIDEVRIYNRALSATEILNLYNDLK
jgi:prepilin-type N-terminal cleavage/methylation domain-containing protein